MKTFLLLPLLLAAPAFAGTSAKQVVAPAPDPCLTTWFAGASVGYLTEFEAPMYNAHFGLTNSCWKIGAGSISLFAEVGYTQKDESDTYYEEPPNTAYNGLIRVKEDFDVTIVPITANIKYDYPITSNLNFYIGAGLGMAWIDVDVSEKRYFDGDKIDSDHYSDSDWVFTAQIFAGLSYSVSTSCDIYGGARWIYYADPTLFGSDVSLDDDWLFELGARFKF
jgi:opacity protein-like surface antigen